MWFKTLPKEDQQLLVDAFKSDGFEVRKIDFGIIAQKNGQKIIITRLDNAKLVVDLKNYLSKRGLLTNEIGGIDFYTILKFLTNEKRLKETYIDCLKRVSAKFNWASVSSGELELSGELAEAVGQTAQYLEVETDDGQLVTLLSIKDNDDNEKMYATNQRFFKLINQLNKFDQLETFRDLAPNAYLMLQAINV
jgi:hypothetical protein